MVTDAEGLKSRTRTFAVHVIQLVRSFPMTIDAEVVGRQLIRSGTSVAANYRAACRSRSPAEFVAKISVVCEEADESQFWIDIVIASKILETAEARKLLDEASQLTAIATASRNTAKSNIARKRARSVVVTLTILAIPAILAILAI